MSGLFIFQFDSCLVQQISVTVNILCFKPCGLVDFSHRFLDFGRYLMKLTGLIASTVSAKLPMKLMMARRSGSLSTLDNCEENPKEIKHNFMEMRS